MGEVTALCVLICIGTALGERLVRRKSAYRNVSLRLTLATARRLLFLTQTSRGGRVTVSCCGYVVTMLFAPISRCSLAQDDCMSIEGQLVRVPRSTSISVEFLDEAGELVQFDAVETSLSELLQHEIDHLDGILAVDRAVDKSDVIARADFEADREKYLKMVDYVIEPTPMASE